MILGSGAVSPLDMTHAYSTIAANGVRRDLLAFTRVERYGGGVDKYKPDKGKSVIPDGATADVTKFLDANVHICCTGLNANVGDGRAQAGKTGTTDDHTDAWFCGYTPNLAACVWVGYPRGEIAMNLGGPIPGPAFGGGYPATIWRVFAQGVFADQPAKFPPTPWPVPHNFITFKPWHSPNFTLRRRPRRRRRASPRPARAVGVAVAAAVAEAARPPAGRRPPRDDGGGEVLRPAEALAQILERVPRLEDEEAAVLPALAGRVLAADVRAAVSLPPFATSAMDGYAVRAAELGDGPVPIAFRLAAGDPPRPLPAGSVAGIATGAPMPPGADAVVPVEDAEEVEGALRAGRPEPGAHIRPAGGDVESGRLVAEAGRVLTPALLAAVAAVGAARVRVARRPRLAAIATGSELVRAGESLGPGQITSRT